MAGLFGGFDDNTLAEFQRAANMAKGVGIFTRPLYKLTALGTKLFPLHNKFPVSIFPEAAAEAASLTQEKQKLVI